MAAAEIARLGMVGLHHAYGAEVKTQEPEVTGAILHTIGGGLCANAIAGLRWQPMVLPSKAKGAAEKVYGADALIVLDIQDGVRHVQKGVLVQSKMAHRRDTRLAGQCDNMLKLTSSAFVFKFAPMGIAVERATKYCSNATDSSGAWSFEDFIYEFLDCTQGDTHFKAATLTELKQAAKRANARQALLLKAKSP